MTEAQLQKRCTALLDAHGIEWLHIPKRASRGHRSAGQRVKSWPDLTFMLKALVDVAPNHKFLVARPCAVELKVKGGAWQKGQRERMAKMARNGWECYRVESEREFERVLAGTAEQWREKQR